MSGYWFTSVMMCNPEMLITNYHRSTDRQTDRQTDMHVYILTILTFFIKVALLGLLHGYKRYN